MGLTEKTQRKQKRTAKPKGSRSPPRDGEKADSKLMQNYDLHHKY
jgi:hypothetical protein